MSVGERLAVGRVRSIHGLRGAVRVEILTDRPEERFRQGATLFREGSDASLTVVSAHADEPGWLMRFAEVSDRTAAESLREIYLESEVLPGDEPARGEYYWHEVIGATVLSVAGEELGRVEDVYRAGAAEVFVVRGDVYGEFDLPAVRAFIRIFAPKRGEIVVDTDALDLQPVQPRRPRGRKSRRAERTGVPLPAIADAEHDVPTDAAASTDASGPTEVAAPTDNTPPTDAPVPLDATAPAEASGPTPAAAPTGSRKGGRPRQVRTHPSPAGSDGST